MAGKAAGFAEKLGAPSTPEALSRLASSGLAGMLAAMKINGTNTVPFLALLALSLSTPVGCRLRSPSIAEQQELSAKGAITGNSTDWTASPLRRNQQVFGGAGIPDYTRGPAPIDPLGNGIVPDRQQTVQTVAAPEKTVAEAPTEKDESPLVRIARSCPGTDTQVTDALKTVDREQRIQKYEGLVAACPASSELWMWLGIDYDKADRIDPAKHAFEQAVLLNPSNQEAKGHLSAVQRKLADSMRVQ